jgi:large subunit ribosomal protein L25
MHLDFLRIQMKKEIETSVPIRILNEEIAIGIKDGGGVLQHGLRELNISCLPADIPENIIYDIKDLDMGIAIRVEDIEVSEKIKILNGPREVIVSIIHPTQLKEEDLVTEEEEGEEEEAEEPELIGKEKPVEGDEPEEGQESKEEIKGSKEEVKESKEDKKGFKKGSKKDKKESKRN